MLELEERGCRHGRDGTGEAVVMSESVDRGVRKVHVLPDSWVGTLAEVFLVLAIVEVFVRRPFGFRGVFASMIASGVAALVAITWKKDRSVLLWALLVVGALATVWTVAEILFPH